MSISAVYRAIHDFGEDSPEYFSAQLAVLEKDLSKAYDGGESNNVLIFNLSTSIAECKRMIAQFLTEREMRLAKEQEAARQLAIWKQDVESRSCLCGF